jgi:hypothetical protein
VDRKMRRLLDKAFRVVPGAEFNEVRHGLVTDGDGPRLVCEAVVPEEGGWEKVKQDVYPAQCRYFKVKRIDPLNPQDVVVALFHEGAFHLIRGTEFIDAYLQIEGMDTATFRGVLEGWLCPEKAVLGSKIELLA